MYEKLLSPLTYLLLRCGAGRVCAVLLVVAVASMDQYARAQPTAATVLVVGDSISAAYGMPERDGWVALLQEKLQAFDNTLTVVNASISGDTTAGGVRRLPAALQRFQPELVIIELGGNDGLRGQSLKQLRENLVAMVEMAQQAQAEVLLLGMQIPSNYGPAYTSRFASTFTRVADETGAAVVPFLLAPFALDSSYFQPDGVHPTAAAQPLMLELVLPQVFSLLNIPCNEETACRQ